MSTVILLSSSPPRLFAPSPTPAQLSSLPYLPSPNVILRGKGEAKKGFKNTPAPREGFRSGFTNARSLLDVGKGKENFVIQSRDPKGVDGLSCVNRVARKSPFETRDGQKLAEMIEDAEVIEVEDESLQNISERQHSSVIGGIIESAPGDDTKTKVVQKVQPKKQARPLSPLLLEKAASRRLDWTPPPARTDIAGSPVGSPRSPTRSFSVNLHDSFGHKPSTAVPEGTSKPQDDGNTSKRRKIELPPTNMGNTTVSMAPPVGGAKSKPNTKTSTLARKRATPLGKKYTTITGLATALYGTSKNELEDPSPMARFLTSTQIGDMDDSVEQRPSTAGPKRKRTTKKPPKSGSKCKVLSPESAIKAHHGQEAIFGSASQLAREDSPSFLKDTMEALKRSATELLSDPMSTQMTQPISIESTTPRSVKGTARYAKSRNLWAAADRDEDNALLHVDAVDMFDTPGVRMAFTGKDVLLEPGAFRSVEAKTTGSDFASFHGVRPCNKEPNAFYDIDDITTPMLRLGTAPPTTSPRHQTRAVHTSTAKPASQKLEAVGRANDQVQNTPSQVKKKPAPSKAKANTTKPIYNGYTDTQLQKQISAFGFKPIKKRDKMIEVLERCWENKHGPTMGGVSRDDDVPQEDSLKHGDFLSKVHDISARPEPKPKKPKGRVKKDKAEPKPKTTPKRRKKAEPKSSTTESVKPKRKRTLKASALSEERVIDVDDIEHSTTEGPLQVDGPTEHKSRAAAISASSELTLPATVATAACSVKDAGSATASTPFPTPAPSQPDLNDQITRAVTTYVPSPGRNHQKNPTWQEKILMYDPIVLEDLATWLNTEGLGRIGEDREVSALEVRTWCETRGVCCLWRGGWRGNRKENQLKDVGEDDK